MKHKRSHDLVTFDKKIDVDPIQEKSPRVCPWNLRSSQTSVTVKTTQGTNLIFEDPPVDTPIRVDKVADVSGTSISMTEFQSCLSKIEDDNDSFQSPSCLSRTYILQRALSIQELEPSSWLSSSLMNLALSRFAREYIQVRFMPIDFSLLISTDANTKRGLADENTVDILGRVVSSKDKSLPLVIIFNMNNIHWNLIRIIFSPKPELQLFEPMGKPMSRHRGLSYRNIPRSVISWLDHVYPLANGVSWITIGESAITRQQQINSYDCGVACLLYAEKCGLGQSRESINLETDQQQISQYRIVLQDFTKNESMSRSTTVDMSWQ